MGLYIRNNRYYYRKKIQGKTYYRALKLKRGQERLLSARLEQVEEEVLAEHFDIPYSSQKQISFNEYIEEYLKSKIYKKRWKRDKQSLRIIAEVLGHTFLSIITKRHIEKLEKFLFDRKLKPSTVNRYFEVLRHFFNLAIEDGYARENPVRFYVPFVEDGQRRALIEEEIKRILAAARSIQENPKSELQSIIHDLIVFDLNTGMRLSEVIKLKKSYIRDDVIFYPITETKYRRKAHSQRKKVKLICLNSIALSIVKKMNSQDDYVFPIKWRDPNVIRKTIGRIRDLSGVEDFTFHQLRHTVSTIISSQVSLSTAKAILGHSDIKTTLRYTHPELAGLKAGVAKIEEYFKDLQG